MIPRLNLVVFGFKYVIFLLINYLIIWQRTKFTVADNYKYKKKDIINDVQSSLKFHPLWVTLYIVSLFSCVLQWTLCLQMKIYSTKKIHKIELLFHPEKNKSPKRFKIYYRTPGIILQSFILRVKLAPRNSLFV